MISSVLTSTAACPLGKKAFFLAQLKPDRFCLLQYKLAESIGGDANAIFQPRASSYYRKRIAMSRDQGTTGRFNGLQWHQEPKLE